MLDLELRTAILALQKKGHGLRKIALSLKISRNTVRRVLRSGQSEVPAMIRDEQLSEHLEHVRKLYNDCEGNLVRVGEELERSGVVVAYSTLTSFCRRHAIGVTEPVRVGRYHFKPGQEMQHDTSPHKVKIADKYCRVECASLVLCYSRVIYLQVYPRWTRFECRVFLTEALKYFGGAAGECMVDNSSVIRAHGTGKSMVPAGQMCAFAERFGFKFKAHELGDANRSAVVERMFHYVENNFYVGRTFSDFDDLNRQLREWCVKISNSPRRLGGELKVVPMTLFAVEQKALRGLPLHVPEIYDLFTRRVGVEGYVTLHRNRYSVAAALIGRSVEVRETIDKIRIFDGHQLVSTHARVTAGKGARRTLSEHTRPARAKGEAPPPSKEETLLRAAVPELNDLLSRLRKHHGGQATRAVRQLHRLYLDYPTPYLIEAVNGALEFGLIDLKRIETMVLRQVREQYFRIPTVEDEHG